MVVENNSCSDVFFFLQWSCDPFEALLGLRRRVRFSTSASPRTIHSPWLTPSQLVSLESIIVSYFCSSQIIRTWKRSFRQPFILWDPWARTDQRNGRNSGWIFNCFLFHFLLWAWPHSEIPQRSASQPASSIFTDSGQNSICARAYNQLAGSYYWLNLLVLSVVPNP